MGRGHGRGGDGKGNFELWGHRRTLDGGGGSVVFLGREGENIPCMHALPKFKVKYFSPYCYLFMLSIPSFGNRAEIEARKRREGRGMDGATSGDEKKGKEEMLSRCDTASAIACYFFCHSRKKQNNIYHYSPIFESWNRRCIPFSFLKVFEMAVLK